MTELARVDPAALESMEPSAREIAVTAYLSDARDRLALALEATGPEAVAALKAEIATAAEATKQLGLSKEIQTDAQEMVRRAEFALGKAIRAGQERGEIAKSPRLTGGGTVRPSRYPTSSKPSDFASHGELVGNDGAGIYGLSDGVTEPQFEAALSDAREEGNLSRANVVRKIKGVKSDGLTPVEKLIKIRSLAPSGRTSGQIATEIGASEEHVRRVARANGIEITADRVMNRSRRGIDSNHIVQETVTTLEGLVVGIGLIKVDDLDPIRAENWAVSLSDSIRALNRLVKQIKEMTQ